MLCKPNRFTSFRRRVPLPPTQTPYLQPFFFFKSYMRRQVQTLVKNYAIATIHDHSHHYHHHNHRYTFSKLILKTTTLTAYKMLNLTIAVSNMFNSKKQGKLPPISDQLLLMPAHKLSKMIKDGSVSSVFNYRLNTLPPPHVLLLPTKVG